MSAGTPKRPIRLTDELWAKVRAKAQAEDTTAAETIRRLLEKWVEDSAEPTELDWHKSAIAAIRECLRSVDVDSNEAMQAWLVVSIESILEETVERNEH